MSKEKYSFIDELARKVEEDESKPSEAIEEREKLVKDVYALVQSIVSGEDVRVTCELHLPYPSVGSVSVIGKGIEIENSALLARAIGAASNFEVYPKTDGTVQMNLTFHGLTRKKG